VLPSYLFLGGGNASDCDVADITLLTRYIAGESATLGNVCKPYSGSP
jgi:hypothetical protein